MSPCKLQLKLVLSNISSSHLDSSQEIVACLAGLVDFGQATAQFQPPVARYGSISIKKNQPQEKTVEDQIFQGPMSLHLQVTSRGVLDNISHQPPQLPKALRAYI